MLTNGWSSAHISKCFRKNGCIYHDIQQKVNLQEAIQAGIRYQDLKDSLKSLDNAAFEQSCQRIFTNFYQMGFEQAKIESIYMIYQVSVSLRENNDDILKVFPQEVDYYEKIQRITSLKEMEIWMTNYLRWIMDYLEHNYDRRQNDVIQKQSALSGITMPIRNFPWVMWRIL